MSKYHPTDYDNDFNPNEDWEQQDDETDEEYQERLDDWNGIIDILND